MPAYDTLSAAVDDLQRRGYTDELALATDHLRCDGKHSKLRAGDLHIDEFYRFEGETDPGDESIVYAISAPAFGIKGVLVNGYGADAQPLAQELVAKLRTH